MGQDKKINIGRFVSSMQWLEPIQNKYPTGFVDNIYKPSGRFLSNIISEDNVLEGTEREIIKRKKITFIAWRYDVTTDWKVLYNGIKYNLNKASSLERGLYAEYTVISE